MFFSIIIPTYNPKEFLPDLLESISHNDCLDDLEIIISDDCSTEPFDDVINLYKDKLHIVQISNPEHVGFPRNGRQHGAEVAKGKWICFSDQDDYFLDNAFDKLKKYITESNITNYLVSDFIIEFIDNGDKYICDKGKGWTHGKFYEKAFWDKYKIEYDDLQYCEDINLSVKLGCLLLVEKLDHYECDEPFYVWRKRKDSLSSDQYFVNSMPDYVQGTLGVIIKYVKNYKDNEELLNTYSLEFLNTFLHFYFYIQSDLIYPKKEIHLNVVRVIQPIFTEFKNITGLSNKDIINIVYTDMMKTYNKTRLDDYNQIPFIEHISFEHWLNMFFD